MGLVPVQSFYLPFALAALEFLLGGSIVAPVIGIIAGHTCAPHWLDDCAHNQRSQALLEARQPVIS